jgi:hypothetical protein
MKPADVPETYLARVRDADARALSELFAEDAVFQGPYGQVIKGRKAIYDFYAGLFRERRPQMVVGRTVIEGSSVVFELVDSGGSRPANDAATAVDLMEIDGEGLISRITVFLRPAPAKS